MNNWDFEVRVEGKIADVYLEAFVMRLRQIDWNDWNILILDVLAEPHS